MCGMICLLLGHLSARLFRQGSQQNGPCWERNSAELIPLLATTAGLGVAQLHWSFACNDLVVFPTANC